MSPPAGRASGPGEGGARGAGVSTMTLLPHGLGGPQMVPRTNPIRGAYSSPIPGYDRIDPPKQAPPALARSIPPLAAAPLEGARQPQARLPLGGVRRPPGPATRHYGGRGR